MLQGSAGLALRACQFQRVANASINSAVHGSEVFLLSSSQSHSASCTPSSAPDQGIARLALKRFQSQSLGNAAKACEDKG